MTCPECHRTLSLADEMCPSCGAVQLALSTGTRLYHRYVITEVVRRAGGIEYLATDEQHQTAVLLLEFFPVGSRRLGSLALLPEKTIQARADWEAQVRAWLPLTIKGIQRPYTLFEQHGTAYAVAPATKSKSLQSRIEAGHRLDGAEATSLLLTLAQMVEELHRQVGGDGRLSPERVSLDAAGTQLTLGWGVANAAHYQAPEQLMLPDKVHKSADVYALAATVLFGLTGEAPPPVSLRALGQPLPPFPVATPEPLRQAINRALSLSPTERLSDPTSLIRLLQPPKGTPVPNHSLANPRSVEKAILPQTIAAHQSWLTHLDTDGEQIVTAGADLMVRRYDATGKRLENLTGLNAAPIGLGLSEVGIVAGDSSGKVMVWAGQQLDSAQAPQPLKALTVRTGRQAISLSDTWQLGIWDTAPLRLLGQMPLGKGTLPALHTDTGGAVWLGTANGQLLTFDEQTLLATLIWTHPQGLPVQAVTSAGSTLALAAGQSVTLVRGSHAAQQPDLPEVASSLALKPDETKLLIGGIKGGLYLLDLEQHTSTLIYRAGARIRALRWVGELIVAGTDQGQLLIFPPL